jgi:hydrogenase small subunit
MTTLGDSLQASGVSRRAFLKFCAALTSLMALPPGMAPAVAEALATAKRPSVIWLSFQECTGCAESLTRTSAPTLENLILDLVSLDYIHALQAASGFAAEEAMHNAMKEFDGRYLLLVDGSIPVGDDGVYGTWGGESFVDILAQSAKGAAAVIAIGSCASFGGLPKANPNPTGARSVSDLVKDKPVVNVPGCPPIALVMTGVLANYLTFGKLPELDAHGRPLAFFGETIHDRCYRRPYYDQGKFAKTFDDEGARAGWCLYELGCKGPTTHNACATVKWNAGTSFPIQSGHGCLGCSEPDFWDKGSFYKALATTEWGDAKTLGTAAAVGVATGAATALLARTRQSRIDKEA